MYEAQRCFKYTLVTLVVGGSVTTIPSDSMHNNQVLTTVRFTSAINTVGGSAFEGCSSLTGVYFESLSDFFNTGFADYYANPLVNGCPLYINNVQATSITVPSDITTIKSYTLIVCAGVTSITVPSTVTHIQGYICSNMSSLLTLSIADSISKSDLITHSIVNGCDNALTLYDNAYYAGNSSNPYLFLVHAAFGSVTTCTIHSDCKYICYDAFGFSYQNLTSITIPASVEFIAADAFSYSTSLQSVTINSTSIEELHHEVFKYCGFSTFTVPNGVETIHSDAFNHCDSMTSIRIPDSVTTIQTNAFSNCSNLTAIYYNGGGNPSTWGAPNATIYPNT